MQHLDDDQIKNKQTILTSNKVDQNKVRNDELRMRAFNALDKRIYTDHTFSGTAEESFANALGQKPTGVYVVGQDGAASIHVDVFKSTKTRIFATSSAANVKARFLVY